jgi:NAD(P)H-dependent FMN reductase
MPIFMAQSLPAAADWSRAGEARQGAMKRLLILWHSRTGGARQMAEAAARAAAEEAVEVRLLPAAEAGPEELLAADGMIFAAPENLAGLTGPMKDFLDRCYYPCLDRLNGRPYAHMICAGSDGTGAARQLARIATGWRLREVAEPLIVITFAQTPEAILAPKTIPPADLARCAELGRALAAGLAIGVF